MSNESIVVSIEKPREVKFDDVEMGQYFRFRVGISGWCLRTDTGYVRMDGENAGAHCVVLYNAPCTLTDHDGNPLTEPQEDTVVVRMPRSVAERVATDSGGSLWRIGRAIRDALRADGE